MDVMRLEFDEHGESYDYKYGQYVRFCEYEKLADALKKYGRHDDHCGDDGYGCYGGECDCGFDDVLERIE